MKYPLLSGMDIAVVDGPLSYVKLIWQKVLRRLLKGKPQLIRVSLGDYVLRREKLSYLQFGISGLCLDVERFLKKGDRSLYYQSVGKAFWYGEDYDTTEDNNRFLQTLESIVSYGYNPESLVELDRNITLQNGTHRTAILLCLHQYTIYGLRFAFRWHWFKDAEQYINRFGLDRKYVEDIEANYEKIEKDLISVGSTFALYLPNTSTNADDLFDDKNIRLLKKTMLSNNGLFYQFCFIKPNYYVDGDSIISHAVKHLERKVIKKGFKSYRIAQNCTEGMRLLEEVKKEFSNE